jgi:hypothetical protein
VPPKSRTDNATTVTVPWRGRTFTVPPQPQWPVEVWESLEDGKFVAVLRAILGPAQWETFKSSSPPPVLADMSALTDAIAKASGFGDAGESSASSD